MCEFRAQFPGERSQRIRKLMLGTPAVSPFDVRRWEGGGICLATPETTVIGSDTPSKSDATDGSLWWIVRPVIPLQCSRSIPAGSCYDVNRTSDVIISHVAPSIARRALLATFFMPLKPKAVIQTEGRFWKTTNADVRVPARTSTGEVHFLYRLGAGAGKS